MSDSVEDENKNTSILEQGTYEIIQNRLNKHGDDLQSRLADLNAARKQVFGAVETKLLATERITTDNKCIPRDMVSVGDQFVFGYNVHMGLRTETHINDVFSVYEYKDHAFHKKDNTLINLPKFLEDFSELYKYYKETQFLKFAELGPYLYMVFQIGKDASDIKSFKWRVLKDGLEYIDNRSDHEVVYPNQHEFTWKRTTRNMYRDGSHPHISIEDLVFVETVKGDLTIKIEDNTEDGKGIYNEPVVYEDQTLDDAEIYYAMVGNLVFLKIKPYKEDAFRYIIYNSKIAEAVRVDEIGNSCVLLPDDHGVIFPKGFYLQTGEYKIFDLDIAPMQFQQTLASANGEDFLYIFSDVQSGTYALLIYNLISQQVNMPTICHGYSLFPDGELCYFKGEEDPQNHHAVQIWQTPFESNSVPEKVDSTSLIAKIGNKDVVRAMAECHEVLNLLSKEDSYANLYVDLVKKTTDIVDSYYWLTELEIQNLSEPLMEIKASASLAIDEFDKVVKIKKSTLEEQNNFSIKFKDLMTDIKTSRKEHIDEFVQLIAQLRVARGEVISLNDLRYVDVGLIKEYEEELAKQNELVSNQCVDFLLKEDSLQFYHKKIDGFNLAIETIKKVIEVSELEEGVLKTSKELEMLIEVVSDLKIEDATQTTKIINNISEIYSRFNQISAVLKRKRKELQLVEGEAVFHSQLRLISQGVVNYLDISDTSQKCEEYLTKLLIQLEELEGKFSDFDEYLKKISEKREEIYNAFESRKVYLTEKLNKKTARLQSSADRIISGVASRLAALDSINAINGYMASDLMVDKLRNIIDELIENGDTVKSDDIQSKLKLTKEEAVRQLRDKTELFSGDGIINFGKHQFSVNNQKLDLSIVPRNNEMYFHITGTNFFEEIEKEEFLATRSVWSQVVVSENENVYRAEYLAWIVFEELRNPPHIVSDVITWADEKLLEFVSTTMASRYEEGYVKGVHDRDALVILKELLQMSHFGGVLKFAPKVRVCATFYWELYLSEETRGLINHQIKAVGSIIEAFPNTRVFDDLIQKLAVEIEAFSTSENLFKEVDFLEASRYLFIELAINNTFSNSKDAVELSNDFNTYLNENQLSKTFKTSLGNLSKSAAKFSIAKSWLKAYSEADSVVSSDLINEASILLVTQSSHKNQIVDTTLIKTVEGLNGTHQRVVNQNMVVDYKEFTERLIRFLSVDIPAFIQFNDLKKQYIETYKVDLKLEELKPRVMSSFVRNKLINSVYLPIIGDNLAKQIGTAGENKRTDLMGMLLLISPPGYGKTTLMEYIASRLGIVFLKINGPSLGHETTSLDPDQAPNAGAREEIQKLNLGFEMGDNVMVYLDDIQHCHPEFLQKFISLSDGQRKIEGVYKGRSKTYDLRGKKVCVVMAGNPYTESGDKFKIPDMLANRADIYNLGDIIGDTSDAFESSYIENCLTSNATLGKLAGKSQKDLYTLIKMAETGSREGLDFESNHSVDDINDYVSVLQKLFVVRDVILKVNMQYIKSAAMEDQYRVEPSFKLQGSYRNMNKIAEKIIPIMNEAELKTILLSAYESESQTLTTSAEANLLKFKEMVGWITEEEQLRWEEIKTKFKRNQKMQGFGENQNQMTMILSQIESVSDGLIGIKNVLSDSK
jgi:hypothetical protein